MTAGLLESNSSSAVCAAPSSPGAEPALARACDATTGMSSMIALGIALEDVVPMVTTHPASG